MQSSTEGLSTSRQIDPTPFQPELLGVAELPEVHAVPAGAGDGGGGGPAVREVRPGAEQERRAAAERDGPGQPPVTPPGRGGAGRGRTGRAGAASSPSPLPPSQMMLFREQDPRICLVCLLRE